MIISAEITLLTGDLYRTDRNWFFNQWPPDYAEIEATKIHAQCIYWNDSWIREFDDLPARTLNSTTWLDCRSLINELDSLVDLGLRRIEIWIWKLRCRDVEAETLVTQRILTTSFSIIIINVVNDLKPLFWMACLKLEKPSAPLRYRILSDNHTDCYREKPDFGKLCEWFWNCRLVPVFSSVVTVFFSWKSSPDVSNLCLLIGPLQP